MQNATKTNGWRKRGHWEWAKEWARLFHDMLPKHVCEAALATCRITLRDKDSTAAGGAWGFAVLTEMQTFGFAPQGVPGEIRRNHHFITLQSQDGADAILRCFDLTLADVIDYYGLPAEGETITLDLKDIVTTLDANYAAIEEAEAELVGA